MEIFFILCTVEEVPNEELKSLLPLENLFRTPPVCDCPCSLGDCGVFLTICFSEKLIGSNFLIGVLT